ncbi:GNAT family N-acetyltransferase [Nocardia sp. CA-128927]|uniref:GNAT family N-acetyltransferase n=1 Tax=Nocardia sp. CA-128927 TaxID=3239975 RepID=UPI003D96EBE9
MGSVGLRQLEVRDEETLTELIRRNRKFLYGWMPTGDSSDEENAAWVRDLVAGRGGADNWFGLVELAGQAVGALSMRLQRGIASSAVIGYWVAEEVNGKGVATEAIGQCLDMAFWKMGLHRVDAFVREDNIGSCRALEKNGFHRVGLSRGHLHIAGRWWDMVYFQKLAPWADGVRLAPPTTRSS